MNCIEVEASLEWLAIEVMVNSTSSSTEVGRKKYIVHTAAGIHQMHNQAGFSTELTSMSIALIHFMQLLDDLL